MRCTRLPSLSLHGIEHAPTGPRGRTVGHLGSFVFGAYIFRPLVVFLSTSRRFSFSCSARFSPRLLRKFCAPPSSTPARHSSRPSLRTSISCPAFPPRALRPSSLSHPLPHRTPSFTPFMPTLLLNPCLFPHRPRSSFHALFPAHITPSTSFPASSPKLPHIIRPPSFVSAPPSVSTGRGWCMAALSPPPPSETLSPCARFPPPSHLRITHAFQGA
ncbi:hypothetical protein B0H17DRAFT_354425 [Mycena rosella]|uniref:Uncharacterized protein n=1 Tax=Mycena rosella TaxID=1033263 RepID=A0AAD7CQ76_MYCRO|nr:hypothetical protein B0H17DRAFT_354425 [Mycena rosella]